MRSREQPLWLPSEQLQMRDDQNQLLHQEKGAQVVIEAQRISG